MPTPALTATWFDLHEQYVKYSPRWVTVTDIEDGGPQLKLKDIAKYGTYLSEIPIVGTDTAYYNTRNRNYIYGAGFTNYTELTLNGLMGMLFRKNPSIPEMKPDMEYILKDSDGNGFPLMHHIRNTANKVIKLGRHGILTDMPAGPGRAVTKAEIAAGLRPTIKAYSAQSIQYWDDDNSLIILKEVRKTLIDGEKYKKENKDVWRVLEIIDGKYTVSVLDEKGVIIEPERTPLKADRTTFSEIPFIAIGSVDNFISVDSIPIEAIALANLAHYQDNADEQDASRQMGAGTPWIASTPYKNAIENPNDKTDKTQLFGPAGLLLMGDGGQAGVLQFNANTMVGKMREAKEKQIESLGAQIISPVGPAQTAEATRTQKASQASRLDVISVNIADGYDKSLGWVAEFLGVEYDGGLTLNREFIDPTLTPEQRNQIVSEVFGGFIPHRLGLEEFHRAGVFNLDDKETVDDIIAEIGDEGPGSGFGGADSPV